MPIQVKEIEAVKTGSGSRVQALVNGLPVWFESDEVELKPCAEAFGCAFLIPALQVGEELILDEPVDPLWLENLNEILNVTASWWGYAGGIPKTPVGAKSEQHRLKRTGLCFSGGVDSFFSLLRPPERIDDLVTVFGFDMRIGDEIRIASVKRSVREIAEQTGKRPIFAHTNLREHPAFAEVSWERAHGGAMAAIGHVLSGEIGRLIISSSIARANDRPWGSHASLDRYWSSAILEIVNFGSEFKRVEKLHQIFDEPILYKHLRVCWENRTPTGNCSLCTKCLRTRLALADSGVLDKYTVFSGSAALAADLRAIQRMEGRREVLDFVLARARLPKEILDEARALAERSRSTAFVPEVKPSLWRRIRKWVHQQR